MEAYRIGLVGCGRIASYHARAFEALGEAMSLAAVCDVVPERAEAMARETGARPFTDHEEMLDALPLDAVSICTPSGLHPSIGIDAAKRGVHVISEKPLGVRLDDVDELIRVCDEAGVHLFCVKQNRLNTTMQLLKRAVDKGRFGNLYFLQTNVFWQRPQSYYDAADWRGTWALDGGAFLNQASHYVDALHWLGGKVTSVTAQTATLAREIEAEDSGAATLAFENGAVGAINVTMLAYPRNLEGSITILGERGTVRLGGVAVNRFDTWDFECYDDDDKLVVESNYAPPNVYGFGHLAYMQNVLEVLRGEREPQTDGRAGRKSLEVILAIYRSAREGRRVDLPLDPAEA